MATAVHDVKVTAHETEQKLAPVLAFAKKVSDDAVTVNAGALAYSLLFSVVPLLVGLLGLVGWGYFLVGHSPHELTLFIAAHLPRALSGGFAAAIVSVVQNQAASIGIVSVVISLFTGASFFQNVDYVLSVIYRLKQRDFAHEWLMALGMTLLLIPLIVVIVLATSVPQILATLARLSGATIQHSGLYGSVVWLAAFLAGTLAAFALFAAIYIVVPNQRVPFKDIKWGALFAAVLLEAYTLLFPFYVSNFVHPDRMGANMGFAIVVVGFFYYFAIILLLGAEFNSWLLGDRDLRGPLPAILQRLEQQADVATTTVFAVATPRYGAGSEPHTHDVATRATTAKVASLPVTTPPGSHPTQNDAAGGGGAVLDPHTRTFPIYVLALIAIVGLIATLFGMRRPGTAENNS